METKTPTWFKVLFWIMTILAIAGITVTTILLYKENKRKENAPRTDETAAGNNTAGSGTTTSTAPVAS